MSERTAGETDVVVVGAGPAGMAAATRAASLGLRVRVVDEQQSPGGQVHRGVTRVDESVGPRFGDEHLRGRELVRALHASTATVEPGATVFDGDPELGVAVLRDGIAHEIRARHLIVATGAIERAVPFPGWTLPGVMNAGAAQVLLETSACVPSGRVVLAGCGPLLLLVASQLADAGANVVAVVETTGAIDHARALPEVPRALATPATFARGLAWLRALRRHGVERIGGIRSLAAEGAGRVERVLVGVGDRTREIAVDTLLVHAGVVPNPQLARLMRLEHRWDERALAWRPRVDAFGRSSDPRVSVAGDGAGIGGARAAETDGAIAAIDAAHALGAIDAGARERLCAPLLRERRRHLAVRPWLDALYRPPGWLVDPPDAAIVCRCEDVTAGEIRSVARLGVRGPNQAKAYTRCGMGPCQGRVCGTVVTTILARAAGVAPAAVGYTRIRPPLVPVPLAALARMPGGGNRRDERTGGAM